jgi:membrane peptidoglycan carboxypeptidase
MEILLIKRLKYRRSQKRKNKRARHSFLLRNLFVAALSLTFISITIFLVAYQQTNLRDINSYTASRTTVIKYSNGAEVGRIYREDRVEVPFNEIPIAFRNAIVSAEDSNFYSHLGLDLYAISKALFRNATGSSIQGGSTITQQYAKIAFLKPERKINRKIKEVFYALKIEGKYSKNEILEKYTNAVYFGRNAYGLEIAARKYFGVNARFLDPAQSIVLAAVVRSPANYDPAFNTSNLSRLMNRFQGIKTKMISNGYLTQSEADQLLFPQFGEYIPEDINSDNRGHLISTVKDELRDLGLSENDLAIGGFTIETTLDQRAQTYAELAVKSQKPFNSPADLHVGLATIRPGTGEIVALYGGNDYLKKPLNDATQSIAQAGSTFKVFALIAALEKGYSLSTVWDGRSPQKFKTNSGPYLVSNYGNSNYGPTSLLRATASSINTIYVRVGLKVGADSVVDVVRRAGIPESVEVLPTPSIVLGVSSPHVIDIASAFATFAANGIYAKPFIVKRILDQDGKVFYSAQIKSKRVFSKAVMSDLAYALTGVIRNGTASPALGNFPRPIAGKTGTSQNNASAWFSGYSPELATSVAFFRDSPQQRLTGIGGLSSITGGTFPARIWNAYMRKALKNYPVTLFPRPAFVGGSKVTYVDVVKPSPSPTAKPTKTSAKPNADTFNPQKVPGITIKPIPINTNKPIPGTADGNNQSESNKPIPEFTPKKIP